MDGECRPYKRKVVDIDSEGDVPESAFETDCGNVEFVCSLGVPLVGIAALVGDVSVVAVNLESLNFEGVGDPALLYGKLLVAHVQQKQPTAISETDVTQRMGRNICDPKYKKN